MKYSSKIYASALIDSYGKKPAKEIAAEFLKLVRRNGDFAKLPKVLMDFKKLYNRKNGIREVKIKLARENSNLIEEVKSFLKLKEEPLVEINKEILGGAVITIDDEIIIDGSIKTRIAKIFK